MVIAARGAERDHHMAREIEAGGARALFVRADVSQAADVHGLVKTTVDCWGRLDCAFNNAAAVEEPFVPTAAFTEAQFDRSLALNLKSFWLRLEQQIRQTLAPRAATTLSFISQTYARAPSPVLPRRPQVPNPSAC